MFNAQCSILNVQVWDLSPNSYHTPVMDLFRVKVLKICGELTTQLFCLAANILVDQRDYIFAIA